MKQIVLAMAIVGLFAVSGTLNAGQSSDHANSDRGVKDGPNIPDQDQKYLSVGGIAETHIESGGVSHGNCSSQFHCQVRSSVDK
jgi:hypothetical protein